MKKYTSVYKTVTKYGWSFNFETKLENVDYNVTNPNKEAIKHLREMFAKHSDEELVDYLECWDEEKIEVEDEPDWDTLPGGKDYD